MLKKEKLMAIPPLDYPKGLKKPQYHYGKIYVGAAQIKIIKGYGKIFILDIYEKESKALSFRSFADKSSVITYDFSENEWSRRVLRDYIGGYNSVVLSSEEDDEKASQFFKGRTYTSGRACEIISSAQREKNYETHLKAQNTKLKNANDLLNRIPKYPKGLYQWAEKLFGSYILISDRARDKTYKGLCSSCGAEFRIGGKPGDEARCPKCNKKAELLYKSRAEGKRKEESVWWATTIEGEKVLIASTAHFKLNKSFKEEISFTKSAAFYFDKEGKPFRALKLVYKIFSGYEWCIFKNGGKYPIYSNHCGKVWPGSLKRVFGESFYNVDLKSVFQKYDGNIDFYYTIKNLREISAAEQLIKMGLIRLATDCRREYSYLNYLESDFKKITSLPMRALKPLRELDASIDLYKFMSKFPELIEYTKELYELFDGKLSAYSQIELVSAMGIKKFISYFNKQKDIQKVKGERLIGWYNDYIDMAKRFRIPMDKSTRFPKDLKAEHDRLSQRAIELDNKKKDSEFKRMVKKHFGELPSFQKGEWLIIPADSNSFLIREGQSLHHCVGGGTYYDKCIKGQSMIFFIRLSTAPDIPKYTAEINLKDCKLLQLYGKNDRAAPANVRQFVEGFIKQYKKGEKEKCKKSA